MRKKISAVITALLAITLVLAYSVDLAAAASGFNDEFTGSSLSSFWTAVDPTGTSTFSLTANPGWLRITANTDARLSTIAGSNLNAPRILQSVTGDFVATTCVTGSFSDAGYRGGLLLWKDSDNFIRLEKWGTNQVLMYAIINGQPTYKSASGVNYNPLYLKIDKSGTTVTGSWSSDGTTWNALPQFTFSSADPVQIGLFVIKATSTGSFSADFNYFHIVPTGVFNMPEYPFGAMLVPMAVGIGFLVYRNKAGKKKQASA